MMPVACAIFHNLRPPMNSIRSTFWLASLFVLGLAATCAHGQTSPVNVNILGGNTTQQNQQIISAGSFAGAVEDDGWNNVNLSPTTYSSDLKDDNGNTTTLQIEGGSNNSTGTNNYAAENNPSTPDEQLNAGGIYVSPGIFITGITAPLYDVYVYTLNDTTGSDFGLTDGTTTYYGTNAV